MHSGHSLTHIRTTWTLAPARRAAYFCVAVLVSAVQCGCDYTGSIKGIGPHSALKLIREHHSIEEALKHIDTSKHKLPEPFQYAQAAELFTEALVTPAESLPPLEWKEADRDGVLDFLVKEKGFNQDRVDNALKKLKAARGKGSQGRIDSFFTLQPRTAEEGKEKEKGGGKGEKRKGAAGKEAKSKAGPGAKKAKK